MSAYVYCHSCGDGGLMVSIAGWLPWLPEVLPYVVLQLCRILRCQLVLFSCLL